MSLKNYKQKLLVMLRPIKNLAELAGGPTLYVTFHGHGVWSVSSFIPVSPAVLTAAIDKQTSVKFKQKDRLLFRVNLYHRYVQKRDSSTKRGQKNNIACTGPSYILRENVISRKHSRHTCHTKGYRNRSPRLASRHKFAHAHMGCRGKFHTLSFSLKS
jgi:hypothetical protein